MLKKLINSQSKTITSAAIIIAALSLVSAILGIFRDRILASEFGAGDALDIYYAAFRLPDLVYSLIILGAISAGLIPIFTALLSKSKKTEGWHLISSTLNILVGALVIACAILFIFTPQLMAVLTPGFDEEKLNLVVGLTRIMYLSPIILAFSAIFGSVLQSFKRFFIFALAPVFYNIGIIIGAIYFVDLWGIYGLAWGVVLGSLLHMSIQLLPLPGLGYKYSFSFDWKNKNVQKVWRLMIPRTLTLITGQINILVITIVASTLAVGSLAIFNLSNNLQSFPLGIFGVSFAIAALPTLSAIAAKRDMKEFVKIISTTFRQILFFVVPISVLLYVLRAQVVRVILGSGSFGWLDTRLTAACLGLFVLSLFAQATVPLIVRGFYALHNSKTPFKIGLVSLVVNLVALLFFREIFASDNAFSFFTVAMLRIADLWHLTDLRILALPMAISVSSVVNLVLLVIWLRKKIGRLDGYKIIDSSLRIIFASLGAGLFAYMTLQFINQLVITQTFMGILAQGFIAGMVGLAGYWILGYLLNMEEMNIFIASMKKKLFKKVEVEGVEN